MMVIPLLWWALRGTSPQAIWQVLTSLHAAQLVLLGGLNAVILILVSARWWLILQALDETISFSTIFSYRLTSFGVSYFTPGPQFGGEPLQVYFLNRVNRVESVPAVTSVFLDKLLELLVNFTVLLAGIFLIVSSGIFRDVVGGWAWMLLAGIMVIPTVHLIALWTGRSPVTNILRQLRFEQHRLAVWVKVFSTVQQAESQISNLLQAKPGIFFSTAGLSALSWVLMGVEYHFITHFIGFDMTLPQVLVAFFASRIAFLLPLPGGLGALEASQVLAINAIGGTAAVGLAISLIMRARDILIGLAGLVLGSLTVRRAALARQNQQAEP